MDDLYPSSRVSSAITTEMEARCLLAATVEAQTNAQRLLAHQVDAMHKAEKHIQLPPRLKELLRPRRVPAPRLSQGLGPPSTSVGVAAPAPQARRGPGRPQGSYDQRTRDFEAGYPAWYVEVQRMQGRAPAPSEAAQHWGINRTTVERTLKRHPEWLRKFPPRRKRSKRL
jgi:hypothetical protein